MKSLFSIILSLAILSSYFSKTRAETIDIPIGIISADSTIAKHGRQINAVQYFGSYNLSSRELLIEKIYGEGTDEILILNNFTGEQWVEFIEVGTPTCIILSGTNGLYTIDIHCQDDRIYSGSFFIEPI